MEQAAEVEPGAAAAGADRLPPRHVIRRVYLTLFFEVAAALVLLGDVLLGRHLVVYVSSNRDPASLRALNAVLPWAGGVVAVLTARLLLRRRPEWARPLSLGVECALPLLVAWAVPPLLAPDVFAERPLLSMLLTGAVALGLEASLRRSLAAYAVLRRARLHPPRLPPCLGSPVLPRVVCVVAISAVAAFFYAGSARAHAKMLTSNFDFGLFENLFWNTLHGRHGVALERHYFAEHAEFFLYGLLPFYALHPSSETLLALQAGLLAGAAVPLYLLAEHWLRSSWAACAFALAYLSHPGLHGPAFYDFHFLPLSAFFILWCAYFHAKSPGSWPFWLSALLAMSCREDVALGAALIGLGLCWSARQRKIGLSLFALGSIWFLFVKFVWMRQFGGRAFTTYYADLIPPGSRGLGAVLVTLLSNPLYALSRMLTEEKALLALQLLVPTAFLPVRYRRGSFLLLPGLVVVGLASSDSAIVRVHFHYTTHFLPYLFVAAIAALAVRSRSARLPTLVGLLFGSLVTTLHWGAFFGERFRTSFHEISFDWTAEDQARAIAMERLARQIPPAASVSAGEYEGPHVSRRSALYALKTGVKGADYILYSPRSLHWGGRDAVIAALHEGYGVVDTDADLTLLGRDRPRSRNAEALREIGSGG